MTLWVIRCVPVPEIAFHIVQLVQTVQLVYFQPCTIDFSGRGKGTKTRMQSGTGRGLPHKDRL
jgi:hypothetical protein